MESETIPAARTRQWMQVTGGDRVWLGECEQFAKPSQRCRAKKKKEKEQTRQEREEENHPEEVQEKRKGGRAPKADESDEVQLKT